MMLSMIAIVLEIRYDGGAAAEEDRNDKESKTPMRKLESILRLSVQDTE